jgi:hypothetical protein
MKNDLFANLFKLITAKAVDKIATYYDYNVVVQFLQEDSEARLGQSFYSRGVSGLITFIY